MSKPTRLKAIAAGVFIGAPVTIFTLLSAKWGVFSILLDDGTNAEVLFKGAKLLSPILLIAIPPLLLQSPRNHWLSYVASIATTGAGAIAIDAFALSQSVNP